MAKGKGTGILLLAAGAAALLFGGRRKAPPASPGPDAGTDDGDASPGPDSSPAPSSGRGGVQAHFAVKNALCTRPMTLSAQERRELIDKVITPAYDARESQLPKQPAAEQVDAFVRAVALDVLKSCPIRSNQTAVTVASQMARAIWWQRTGQSGQ